MPENPWYRIRMHLLYTAPDLKMLYLIVGSVLVFSFLLFVASTTKARTLVRMYGREDGPAKVFDIVAFAAVALFIVTLGVGYIAHSNIQRDSIQTLREDRIDWVESHGVTTQSSTLTDLEFPNDAPDEDTKFGVAQVIADDNSIISVHLAWEDGDFVLYGTDGQPLERLED